MAAMINCVANITLLDHVDTTVKIIIVAGSPIEASPKTLKNKLTKILNLTTTNLNRRATFENCQGPKLWKDNDRAGVSKRRLAKQITRAQAI